MDSPELEADQPQSDGSRPAETAAPARSRIEREGQRLRRTAAALGLALVFAALWLWPASWGMAQLVALFAIAATVSTSCVLAFQLAQLLIDEPLSEVGRVLFGQPLAVRSKARFLTRLQHECSDTQLRARNRGFSLAVIALPSSDEVTVDAARDVVRGRIRAKDVVSDLAAGEIWLLALGADADAVEALTQRLSAAVGRELPPGVEIAAGWSTFEADAFDAKHMISVARKRAGLIDAQVAAELDEAAEQDEAA